MTVRFESRIGDINAWWITNVWWNNFINSINIRSKIGNYERRKNYAWTMINQHLEKYDAEVIEEESSNSDDVFFKVHVLEFKDQESYLAFVLEWS